MSNSRITIEMFKNVLTTYETKVNQIRKELFDRLMEADFTNVDDPKTREMLNKISETKKQKDDLPKSQADWTIDKDGLFVKVHDKLQEVEKAVDDFSPNNSNANDLRRKMINTLKEYNRELTKTYLQFTMHLRDVHGHNLSKATLNHVNEMEKLHRKKPENCSFAHLKELVRKIDDNLKHPDSESDTDSSVMSPNSTPASSGTPV